MKNRNVKEPSENGKLPFLDVECIDSVKNRKIIVLNHFKTSIQCFVSGPRPTANSKEDAISSANKGRVNCAVKFSAISGVQDMKSEKEITQMISFLEKAVVQAFDLNILTDRFPMCVLDISVNVLSFDKFLLCSVINAVSYTLALSRIECKGLVCCTTVLLSEKEEENKALTLALLPNFERITFLHSDSTQAMKDLGTSLSKCLKDCAEVDKVLRQKLLDRVKKEENESNSR